LRRADGKYRWMLNTGVPRFVNGVYVGHIGTISDMTDLKRKQEQRVATQKLESLGVFAAGIAHHFNNMLGSVFADSELALAEVPHDTLAAESIERIKAVAIRASEIVKLLQTYAGGTEISMEKVDLSTVVEEVVQRLQRSISRKTTLRANLARGLPLVRANSEQIGLVVSNLIMNASEALGDSAGSIAVITAEVHLNETMAQVYGRDLPPGNYLRLVVRDNGQGIRENSHPKIFDPFYSTKFLGRGLGLAIVQGILRSHRGGIGLETATGTGATFEVVLPCFNEHSKGTRAAAPSITTFDELPDSGILALQSPA
jgi:signal transduction histidine kinase